MERKQPNGYIDYVDYETEGVIVKFYDGTEDSYEFEELEGRWTDRLGGTYILQGD